MGDGTPRHTDRHTHTHINIMTQPGLGAGPSENQEEDKMDLLFLLSLLPLLNVKCQFSPLVKSNVSQRSYNRSKDKKGEGNPTFLVHLSPDIIASWAIGAGVEADEPSPLPG